MKKLTPLEAEILRTINELIAQYHDGFEQVRECFEQVWREEAESVTHNSEGQVLH